MGFRTGNFVPQPALATSTGDFAEWPFLGDITDAMSHNPVSPANLCLFFGCGELLGFGDNLDQPVSEAVEMAASRGLGNAAAEHFQNVLGGP